LFFSSAVHQLVSPVPHSKWADGRLGQQDPVNLLMSIYAYYAAVLGKTTFKQISGGKQKKSPEAFFPV
jgi:hypothetical protein